MFERYYARWGAWTVVLVGFGAFLFYRTVRLITHYRAPDLVAFELMAAAFGTFVLVTGVVYSHFRISRLIRKVTPADPALLVEIARTSWSTTLTAYTVIVVLLNALGNLLQYFWVRR